MHDLSGEGAYVVFVHRALSAVNFTLPQQCSRLCIVSFAVKHLHLQWSLPTGYPWLPLDCLLVACAPKGKDRNDVLESAWALARVAQADAVLSVSGCRDARDLKYIYDGDAASRWGTRPAILAPALTGSYKRGPGLGLARRRTTPSKYAVMQGFPPFFGSSFTSDACFFFCNL